MIKRISGLVLSLFMGLVLATPASASAAGLFDSACKGANSNSAVCQQDKNTSANNNPITGDNGVIHKVAIFLSTVTAIISVIVIIVAAIKFATAAGNKNAISEAKKYIVYAVVGLIVSALAYTIAAAIKSQVI